jgi:mRNA interferase MazF
MRKSGQVVLFQFPFSGTGGGKLRPALLLGRIPGEFDDWRICMISSQTRHCIPTFDEIVHEKDNDFIESGLKVPSIIRIGRLAVVDGKALLGSIGRIAPERNHRIKERLSNWILGL